LKISLYYCDLQPKGSCMTTVNITQWGGEVEIPEVKEKNPSEGVW
jgi:hypothetical protein